MNDANYKLRLPYSNEILLATDRCCLLVSHVLQVSSVSHSDILRKYAVPSPSFTMLQDFFGNLFYHSSFKMQYSIDPCKNQGNFYGKFASSVRISINLPSNESSLSVKFIITALFSRVSWKTSVINE